MRPQTKGLFVETIYKDRDDIFGDIKVFRDIALLRSAIVLGMPPEIIKIENIFSKLS